MTGAHVVVVGGGPAGTTVAILCAKFGLQVCLIEAVAQRPAPGEALPSGIVDYFKNLGVAERLVTPERLRYHGLDLRWGTRELTWDEEGDSEGGGFRQQGIQIPRDLLDRTLLERAREVGVEVLQPCVARGLMTYQGRICGVVTNLGEVTGNFIIDAAGGQHWLARKLRMNMHFFSPELFGYYGWAEGRCPEREQRPLIASDEHGWIFTSRIDEDLYQFSRMSFSPLDLPGDWLPDEFVQAGMNPVLPLTDGTRPRPRGRLRGADLRWRRVFQSSGNGFFLCGDAVARTDPIGQQGVFKSIVAGFRCALALNGIYHCGIPEEEARNTYSDWVEKTYLRDLSLARVSYQRHPFAPEWLKDPNSIQVGHLEPEPV